MIDAWLPTMAAEARETLMPEAILAAFALLLLWLDRQMDENRRWICPGTALLGLLLAFASVVAEWIFIGTAAPRYALDATIVADGFGLIVQVAVLASSAAAVVLGSRRTPDSAPLGGVPCALVLFAAIGMMVMAASADALVLFVALELAGVSTVLLLAKVGQGDAAREAAMKYLLLGAVASSILLYGLSVLYTVAGSTRLLDLGLAVGSLASYAEASSDPRYLVLFGGVCVLAGLLFRIAAAPFHLWAQDVLEGAPLSLGPIVVVGLKIAGISALVRICATGLPDVRTIAGASGSALGWTSVVALVSILTMIVGTVTALTQRNVRRLVACLAVAQGGFILLGLVPGTEAGYVGTTISIAVFVTTTLGMLGVVAAIEDVRYPDWPDAFAGLAHRSPWLAVSMGIFLLGQLGAPPLAGFVGRVHLVSGLVESSGGERVLLAVVAVLTTAVSAYYTLRILKAMFCDTSPDDDDHRPIAFGHGAVVGLSAVMIVVGGLYPQPAIALSRDAVSVFHPIEVDRAVRPVRNPTGMPLDATPVFPLLPVPDRSR